MFMCDSRSRNKDMMDCMADSKLFMIMAVGAMVYVGAKVIHSMMDD